MPKPTITGPTAACELKLWLRLSKSVYRRHCRHCYICSWHDTPNNTELCNILLIVSHTHVKIGKLLAKLMKILEYVLSWLLPVWLWPRKCVSHLSMVRYFGRAGLSPITIIMLYACMQHMQGTTNAAEWKPSAFPLRHTNTHIRVVRWALNSQYNLCVYAKHNHFRI